MSIFKIKSQIKDLHMASAVMKHSSSTLLPHLYVSAACHLGEVLLLLQGFVDLVVCHAEAAQSGLNGIMGLGKDDKLGHVWDADDLSVHLSGEVDRFLDLPTVYQPKSGKRVGIGKNQ